jgi:CDP-diacylglycerol--glycerol-3-phosphate 3-phosphatidyltransferase
MKINLLPDWIKEFYLRAIDPLVRFFVELELNPNFFTTLGFVLSLIAAYLFAAGDLRLAGVLVLLAGTFDIVDGKVARATNRVTKFGALYDSTLDRYAEVVMFFGLAYHFVIRGPVLAAIAVSIALGGSIMVSYVRARAEGLGFECKVGLMQRPERIVFIGVGAIIHEYVLIAAICLIAVLANFTAVQRLHHIWVKENGVKSEKLTPEEVS